MYSTADFKKGLRIEVDGDPYMILDIRMQSPSARGSNTLVRTKLRNLRTGQLVDQAFKAGDKVKEPDFQVRPAQYLYNDGEQYHFMDEQSFEQFFLAAEQLEDTVGFLKENLSVRALFFNDKVIGIEVPPVVELCVTRCDPGFRGDTVNASTKPATCETGFVAQVPLFVEEGEMIRIDTRDGHYIGRV
jgi:elongation factor P